MLITDALIGEHAIFHLMLGHIEQSLSVLDSLSNLQNRIAVFAFALESHAGLEDELSALGARWAQKRAVMIVG